MGEVDKFTFYYLTGSLHSDEATKLLDEAGIDYKMVVVGERDSAALMAGLHHDLDIEILPVLYRPKVQAEGLKNITKFVNKYLGK